MIESALERAFCPVCTPRGWDAPMFATFTMTGAGVITSALTICAAFAESVAVKIFPPIESKTFCSQYPVVSNDILLAREYAGKQQVRRVGEKRNSQYVSA